MQTIKLEIEDSKVDVVLTIIQNLKDDIIARVEVVNAKKESQDFTAISQAAFETIWENKEDSEYDKFL